MIIYVVMAILCYLLLLISKKTNSRILKIVLILLSFLSLFLISALRVNVGTDYASYVNWFKNINSFNMKYTNFLFNAIIFVIKIFTNNPQWLFVISSFIILGILYVTVIKKYEDYEMIIFLFVALGFFFSSFNGIRQWIAIAIFMYSYRFIINKQFWKYLICIIIASMFHITAILLIPIYFVFKINIKDVYKIIAVLLFLLVFKAFNFNSIIAFFCKIFAYSFYSRYFNSGVDLSQSVGSYLPVLLSFGMLIFYMLFKKQIIKNCDEKKYELNKNLCFYITLFTILNTVNNLFSRFSYYFIPMLIFILPDFFLIFKGKYRTIMKILIIVLGITFMVINTMLKNSNNPLPYTSIFS